MWKFSVRQYNFKKKLSICSTRNNCQDLRVLLKVL